MHKKKKLNIKLLLTPLPILLIVVILFIGNCAFSFYRLTNSIIHSDSKVYSKYYSNVLFCSGGNNFIANLNNYLGNKHYIIAFLNNAEIRPGGGFMGSYADIKFQDNVLSSWAIQDIYVPDGQLDGHVDPPLPIQQAFKTGDWKLRNANWDVNFPDAAKDMTWFFEKGKVTNVDGIVTLNLGLINKWLEIIGPVKPYDFPETVSSQNFSSLAQSYAEDDFFPGSTKKGNYLSSVGKAIFDKTLHVNTLQKIKLFSLLYDQLQKQQILIWLKDENLEKEINQLGWDGSLGSYQYDYFYPIESNLGVNKANYFVDRSINKSVDVYPDKTSSKVTMIFSNKYNSDNVKSKWSGDYLNYQRIVLPQYAQVTFLKVDGKTYTIDNNKDFFNLPEPKTDSTYTEEIKNNFKIVGFWVFVPKETEKAVEIEYDLSKLTNQYKFKFKHQPGVYNIPFTLTLNGKQIVNSYIESDFEITKVVR